MPQIRGILRRLGRASGRGEPWAARSSQQHLALGGSKRVCSAVMIGMTLGRGLQLGAVVLALSFAARSAHADPEDATRRAARNLGTSGVEAYQAGDYATAAEKFDKAYRALKAPSLGLWSARALAKLNRVVEAAERYQEVIRLEIKSGDEAVQRQAKSDAETELAQLAPQIPNIVVRLSGASADEVSIKIGAEPLASSLVDEKRPLNPGRYVVEGTRASQVVHVTVDVKLGETKQAVLLFPALAPGQNRATLTASAASSPTPPRAAEGTRSNLAPWLLVGAGAAVGIGGGVLMFVQSKKASDSRNQNDPALYDKAKTPWTIGLVGALVGGAAAGTGVVLLGINAGRTQTRSTWLSLSAQGVNMGGAF